MCDRNIYICNTVYHVYISLLLCEVESNNTIILTDFTQPLSKLSGKLESLSFVDNVLYIENDKIENEIKNISFLRRVLFFLSYKQNLVKFYNKKYPVLSRLKRLSSINLFVDSSYLARYFMFEFSGVVLYDDGEGSYFPELKGVKYFLKHKIFRLPRTKGFDQRISRLRYRYPFKLNNRYFDELMGKIDSFNLEEVERALNKEKKIDILGVFSITPPTLKGKNMILMTQPFSEDGFVKAGYKIRIYKCIVNYYAALGYKVYIKPHPRENTDYDSIFDSAVVLDKEFPIECLGLIGEWLFDVGVSIQSTASNDARFIKETVVLGYDEFPELKRGKEKVDSIRIFSSSEGSSVKPSV